MDDSLSIKSTDSATTSDEYEFVSLNANTSRVPLNSTNEQPLLKIADNGDLDHLQKCLGEVLNEENCSFNINFETRTKIVQGMSMTESPIQQGEEPQSKSLTDVNQECTLFGCISYLGSAAINAPKSKTEIIRNMAILNDQSSHQAIKVSLSIPNLSDGAIMLYDASNNSVIVRYEIQRIMYFDNGPTDSKENSCFAFTYCHGDTPETALFQCHVFRCDIQEAVIPLSLCFGKALQRKSNLMTNSQTENEMTAGKSVHKYEFEVGLEIKEDDGKGNFSTVPRDRSAFKLRANVKKQVHISIHQSVGKNQPELEIKRCFGFLISRGWNVKDSDMQLLEMISSGCEDEENPKNFVVACTWDPLEPALESLNAEASRLRITLAVDLVVTQIKESVRLPLKIQCKIFPQHERFWSFSKGQLFYHYNMYLKEVPYSNGDYEPMYRMARLESSESDKSILNWNNLTNLIRTASSTSLEGNSPTDDFSDSDEPMVSGSGEVSKECPDSELESWTELLSKWTDASVRPKHLASLVKQGIPEALRGEVWQRLTINDSDEKLMNNYRILISKECAQEAIIKKDIFRTFPAHDYFKEVGGVGQDTLFNISKAYTVFDSDVGYYQGLTFIAASLLLHMPEEQAFCVLVRLMFDYKLRDLYKDDFEVLKMKQYQLSRLLEEKDPQLWQHFKDKSIETHMFAHVWFLTLYTARFPLYFVFFTLDVVLVQGLDTIFQIALSLLMTFREDLLQLDFENIVKYIQVTLPKKCRNHNLARKIIKRACNIKLKKLKKYEREYHDMKIARNHVEARGYVDNDANANELSKLQRTVALIQEEKRQLLTELTQTKETLIAEMEKAELESQRNAKIIADYKQICQRLDAEQTTTKSQLESLQAQISSCDRCNHLMNDSSPLVNGTKYSANSINNNNRVEDATLATKVTELELELAQTKLALVEAECRNQDLTHQMGSMNAELQTVRNQYPPWLHKTLSSIKEVTANKRTVNTQNVTNKFFNATKTETISN